MSDPVATARPYDYADSFDIRLSEPDPCDPETWVRAGLESTSGVVDRIADLLGLGGTPAPGHVGPFRVVESGPEVVHLEADVPLLHVAMVGRRVEPALRVLTTVLRYRRPVPARLLWALIGPVHRRTARGILTSTLPAAAGKRRGEDSARGAHGPDGTQQDHEGPGR